MPIDVPNGSDRVFCILTLNFTCFRRALTNRINFWGILNLFIASRNFPPVYVGGFETYKKKLPGFSPQANYTDLATAACRRS
jgi:hypothetical protein